MLKQPIVETAPRDRKALEGALIGRLLHAAKLDRPAAERASRLCQESGQNIEIVLANLGLASERDIAEAISAVLRLPLALPAEFPEVPVLDDSVSVKFLREARVLPLALDDDEIVLAMADPLDDYAIRALEMSLGKTVVAHVAAPSDIEAAYERWKGAAHSGIGDIVDAIEDTGDDRLDEDIGRLRDLASEAPVIRLVNLLISRAIDSRASDVHVEPFGSRLLVRYRVDGVMREGAVPPPRLQAAVISRIKIMARMNIAERRLPQDGRIRFTSRGRDYDLRVSTMPTLHGEAVVIRILDRASLVPEFSLLGFAPDIEDAFTEVLSRPQGITLVTGPTGSGKTTTLYTGLQQLNDPGKKLFTIEDPIEYELDGVNQVQVKNQIDLGFARVLRSILRHDPDIVMIGEIRDLETANVAAQAALTGHTVLSTLHTNDAPSAVTRLLDMGVEGYLVTSTLNAVLAQRLVRKLCMSCRAPYTPAVQFMADTVLRDTPTFYKAIGCEACGNTGFHGRMVITELLVLTDEVRALVIDRADARAIGRAAMKTGMRTMYEDGMMKVRTGLTTIDDVMRVTREA